MLPCLTLKLAGTAANRLYQHIQCITQIVQIHKLVKQDIPFDKHFAYKLYQLVEISWVPIVLKQI